jgi:thioredoxin reductase
VSRRTVAIIGAGPAGLAAAASCLKRGHIPIVFEAETPGASLARWGPTRFYTPLAMNLTPAVLEIAGSSYATDALLTGPETAEILEVAAASPRLTGHVHREHRVLRVTRDRLARGEMAGHPVRAELPFRLVVSTPNGEQMFEADAVLDASGTYSQPVPLAIPGGGVAAIRDLGALHALLGDLANKRVLLVGHGHSAATALLVLEGLAHCADKTSVIWAVRSRNLRPVAIAPSDPLPERERVVTLANALAQKPPPWLRVERAATVESFLRPPDGVLRADLRGGRTFDVDRVVALIGYRPDLELLSELPLEIAPATEGAAGLYRALANVTDCLSVPAVSPADLASGEPRFHLIGSKSYGRARTFLLQTGYSQLETIIDRLFD